jgi:hypothetical protein
MPTDSGNGDSSESPQYELRPEEEIGEISVDNHDPVKVSWQMHILGGLLRFLGMAVIIGSAALFLIAGANDGGPIILALVGAGLHFAGRKLAPGAHWASAAGGAVAGIGSIAMVVAVIFFILAVLGVVGTILSVISGA